MTASTLFLLLIVLACPLMMILMMRGGHGHGGHAHGRPGADDNGHRLSKGESAAELRSRRDDLDRLIEEREAEEETAGRVGDG